MTSSWVSYLLTLFLSFFFKVCHVSSFIGKTLSDEKKKLFIFTFLSYLAYSTDGMASIFSNVLRESVAIMFLKYILLYGVNCPSLLK